MSAAPAASSTTLNAIVANAPLALFALDRDGVFTFSDGQGLAVLRLRPDQMVGASVFQVWSDMPALLGQVRRALAGRLRDITDRRDLEDQLLPQALHDALTGLPNRALFGDQLEQALATSRSGHGAQQAALLVVDLDDFKAVNDHSGHAVGDRLLLQRLPAWPASIATGTRWRGSGATSSPCWCRGPGRPRRKP